MKYKILSISITTLVVILFGITGCQKPNSAIDNNMVIEIPYTMYFGDTAGVLYNTNDGITIKRVPFPADGYPFRAIAVSKSYLLFAKTNNTIPFRYNTHLYYSSDNGYNFHMSYDSLKSIPGTSVNGIPYDLNQTVIIDIPKWNRIYAVSNDNSSGNFFGLVYSFTNGTWGSWTYEIYYNFYRVNLPIPTTITSLTFTSGNVLFCWDAIDHRSFYRADTFSTTEINETTSGVYAPGTPLPATGFFSVGHFNNEIIAIDNTGLNGGYFSDDTGINWNQFSGLPLNIALLCVGSPFEEVCFVGTGGAGLYILNINTHTFQPCNNGLPPHLIVNGIVGKENIYKNGNVQKVVYIATNKGIYISKDKGQNWTSVFAGNFTAID